MMSLINYLKDTRQTGKRHFTLEQAIADLGLSKNAILNAIHRLKEQGELISPARGLYVIVPPEHQPQGSIPAEELVPILMNHWRIDYYVSLLTAAMYYGASHQKPARFQVVSSKRIKHPLIFGQVAIEMIYKKSLVGLPIHHNTVNTGYLKVATPELVAYDLLLYQTKSGGLNHSATVLSELIEAIDSDKLIALAELLGEKAWLQRLGYILEKIDPMDTEKKAIIIEKIAHYLNGKINTFIALAPEIPKAGYPRIKKWMIVENTTIESDL